MNGSDKGATSHLEGISGQNRTFGQKVKHHYRRWWWVHIIVVIVIVLVVTLPVVYVAYPHIAQTGVNGSRLVVVSEKALNPAPDAVDLEFNSLFLTNSSYHPQLDAFNASLSLEGRSQPFASFEVPPVKATNGTEVLVRQRIQITNMEEFTRYTETALGSNEYTVVLTGRGGLKLGGLPTTTVDYHQSSTLKGFGGLSDIRILSLTLLKKGYADGTNTIGTVSLFNPTVMTFQLGNVSMSMTGPGPAHLPLGDSVLVDATLVPGQNILNLRTIANQTSIVTVVQEPKYHCGVFPVTINGNNATFDGQVLPYYTSALRAQPIQTTLNVSQTFIDAGYGFVIGKCT